MILVGQYDSPYVRRVAIALHHYGVPFTRNAISVFTDAAEMARINPLVRIPSLVLDDGEVLIDSAAILDHLDETVGSSRALIAQSGPERRLMLQVMALATGSVDKAGAVVYERHFHEAKAVNLEWVARCMGQLAGGLRVLEDRLAGDWFAAGRFTHADIAVGVLLGYLNLRLAGALDARWLPKLAAFSERLEAMPEFAVTRPSPNEVMPG
jgi:glutathione S-transferase